MKTMKKLLALVLALTMVFALSATAFALDEGNELNTGTISIKNPAYGTKYEAYKLLDLESFSTDDADPSEPSDEVPSGEAQNAHYAYKLNDEFAAFFGFEKDDNGKWKAVANPSADANPGYYYIDLTDDQGYVTWKSEKNQAKDYEAFAKAAIKWAETKKIEAAAWIETAAEGIGNLPATFLTTNGEEANDTNKQVPLGYYVVSTNLGALCSLNTTDLDADIEEKNEPVTEKKEVELPDGSFGSENTADIGDTVNFKITIDAKTGAEGFIVHDQMDESLDFVPTSMKVVYREWDPEMDNGNGGYKADVVKINGYTLVSTGDALTHPARDDKQGLPFDMEDDSCICTFHVEFDQDFLDTLKDGDQLVLTYSATINENATVTEIPNENRSILEYGKDRWTPRSDTKTRTYKLDIFKFWKNNENADQTKLPGADFVLYKRVEKTPATDPAEFENWYLQVQQTINGDNQLVWKPLNDFDSETETFDTQWEQMTLVDADCYDEDLEIKTGYENFIMTTDEDGYIHIEGLAAGTYYLHETKAPNGFNKLHDDIKVVIAETKTGTPEKVTGHTTTYVSVDEDYEDIGTSGTATNDKVEVENKFGREMPITGGMGTTLFYVVGSIMMIGAAVILVAKKRTSI